MIKNDWVCVFSVGLYIELHIVDSSCGYTVLWDYLSLGSDNHPPVSLLSSSFLLPCLTLFSWGWCLGEASKNSSGEKASSLQQHGDACQLASLLGYPSSVPLVVTSSGFPSSIPLVVPSSVCPSSVSLVVASFSSFWMVLCLSVFCSSGCHILFFFLFGSSSRTCPCRLIKCGAITVLTLSFCYGLVLILVSLSL